MSEKRTRAEQKYVVLLRADNVVIGTKQGGPLTRGAAWLLERWYNEFHPERQAVALKLSPAPEEY